MDAMFITSFGDDNLEKLSDLPDVKTIARFPHVANPLPGKDTADAVNSTQITLRRGELGKNWHLLHTLSRATTIARHHHTQNPALPTTDFDGLRALQQVSQKGASQKKRIGWQPQEAPEPDLHYAAPLSPLRERDLVALADLFQRDDMFAVETDVTRRLLQLLPEPCWEDDALEFLKEFL